MFATRRIQVRWRFAYRRVRAAKRRTPRPVDLAVQQRRSRPAARECARRCARTRWSCAGIPNLLLHPRSNIASVRAAIRCVAQRPRQVEPNDARSAAGCGASHRLSRSGARLVPAACSSSPRTTRRRSLGCIAARGGGIDLPQPVVGRGRVAVVQRGERARVPRPPAPAAVGAPPWPRAGRGRCRRPAPAAGRGRHVVDGRVGQPAELGDRPRVLERPHPDQVVRYGRQLGRRRLVGQDRQSAVGLHRVAGDDLAVQPGRPAPAPAHSCPTPLGRRSRPPGA